MLRTTQLMMVQGECIFFLRKKVNATTQVRCDTSHLVMEEIDLRGRPYRSSAKPGNP
jgi:hypothetical protein